MSKRQKELVSIGMPIYNEGKYLRKTIMSLLSQTYTNFEIIISDNASTDNTEEICRDFSSKDHRIKYSKNKENTGAIANFNKVLELAKGKYFMWASGHDIWDRSYIFKCIGIMNENKDIVICHAQTTNISKSGKTIKNSNALNGLNISSSDQYTRIHETILQLSKYNPNAIYGLIRLDTLKKIRPVQYIYGSDHVLLIELSLHGKIYQIKEPLYYARMNHQGEKSKRKNNFKRLFSPKKTQHMYLIQTKVFYNYLKTIKILKLPFFKKVRLLLFTIIIFFTKRLRRLLIADYLTPAIGEKNIYKLRKLKKLTLP